MAFEGITFDFQEVTSKCDGAIFRAALQNNDCRLSGAGVAKTADTTLTISAGYILVCGRVIRINTSTAYTLQSVGVTTGVGRLILQINLAGVIEGQTYNPTIIEEYAASASGFRDLTQDNINIGSTVYEVELCQFSVSSSMYSKVR